ncbi:MAG: YjfB family protein [Clostridiales bacterium]|jgi:hypothetical protein|nr:YjfB family protein [Clostridiales bacterium]
MDSLPELSTAMAQYGAAASVGLRVTKMAIDSVKDTGNQIVQMLEGMSPDSRYIDVRI